MSEPIRLGVVALPDAASVEVRQYGADGVVCHQTVHPAADLLAVNGKVAEAVQQAIESPGTVYRLEATRQPKKRKPRKAKRPTWELTGQTCWRRINGQYYRVPVTT